MATGTAPRIHNAEGPDVQFEFPYGPTTVNLYAMCAMRHMHEFGTTSEQLAWIKVAASHHAQHNPNAMLKNVVTVEEVVGSPMVADPLAPARLLRDHRRRRRVIVAHPDVAKCLKRPQVGIGPRRSRPSTRWAARST